MLILPPSYLQAQLTGEAFSRSLLKNLPELEVPVPGNPVPRRGFLKAATAGLMLVAGTTQAKMTGPLDFSPPGDDSKEQVSEQESEPAIAAQSETAKSKPLSRGEIPSDFWQRPRQLWLRRQTTGESLRVVYWKDGKLIPAAYWQVCALLRDTHANKMTSMDPVVLDILAGVHGYYNAWNWPHPVVVTSGFRTIATNSNGRLAEGAAKNSMHLYGKGVDSYIPGVPTRDVAALGKHLKQGGVGFYPSKGFTHLDTGRLRTWVG